MVIMGDIIIWGFINLIFGYKVELVVSDVLPPLKSLELCICFRNMAKCGQGGNVRSECQVRLLIGHILSIFKHLIHLNIQ